MAFDYMGILAEGTYYIQLILFFVIIVGIIALFLWVKLFNKKVRVRTVTGKNAPDLVHDYRAKEVIIDGVKFWKLLLAPKGMPLLPIPPSKSIAVDKKGKMVVEASYTETGEYTYLVSPESDKVKQLHPFTTNQRLSLINQIKKAYAKKRTGWADHMPTIVSVGGLIILCILMFVFWEDITQPSLNAMAQADSITKKQAEIMTIWKEIILKKQMITEAEIVDTLPDEPPN